MMDDKHLTSPRPGKNLRIGRVLMNFNWARSGLWACRTTKGEVRTEFIGLCIASSEGNRALSFKLGPIKIMGGLLK